MEHNRRLLTDKGLPNRATKETNLGDLIKQGQKSSARITASWISSSSTWATWWGACSANTLTPRDPTTYPTRITKMIQAPCVRSWMGAGQWSFTRRMSRMAMCSTAAAPLRDWGLDPAGRILHHDQDSVYTSYRWTGQLLLEDHIRLSYSLSGAKDNPYIESFFSRFKQEGHSEFLDAQTIEELQEVVARRLKFYNEVRYHSALGYRAPLVFLQQLLPEQVIRLHI
jgi:hypothetical protein